LKAADGQGWARSVPFVMWRQPDDLTEALTELAASGPAAESLAVTMTGELCDCFASKAEGVEHILAAAEQAAAGRPVRVYLVDGRFVSINEARAVPHLAAASNWHALASFSCRFLKPDLGRAALLIDVGSTTTDIVPLVDGRVAAQGMNDTERLACGELLYSGVGRTPICAVTPFLPWRGNPCRVAAEVFATMADVYVLLGDVAEEPMADWTADGRPLTLACARQRLARMICADAADLGDVEIERMAAFAEEIHARQLELAISSVIERMPEMPSRLVISGAGEFLVNRVARRSLNRPCLSLAAELGPEVSRCGAAHAVAVLAAAAEI